MRSTLMLLSVLLLAAVPAPVRAASVRAVSVAEMLEKAELVFEGEVLSVRVRGAPGRETLRTCARFRVLDVVKGRAPAPSFELCFGGGRIGDLEQRFPGLVYPEVGERGVYFVSSTHRGLVNPLYGWEQGHFHVLSGGAEPTVTTFEGRAVLDLVPAEPRRGLSDGVARGVVFGERAQQGLSLRRFKARLRELGRSVEP